MTTDTVTLIPATTLSAEQPASDTSPPLSWMLQPHYFVVYAFQSAPINDFLAVGVYTKRSDADAHVAAIKECIPRLTYSVCVIPRSHEELCYELAEARLGPMADVFREMLKMKPLHPHIASGMRSIPLYDKPEFPQRGSDDGALR